MLSVTFKALMLFAYEDAAHRAHCNRRSGAADIFRGKQCAGTHQPQCSPHDQGTSRLL